MLAPANVAWLQSWVVHPLDWPWTAHVKQMGGPCQDLRARHTLMGHWADPTHLMPTQDR